MSSNLKHHYQFIHNVFGDFIQNTKDYFVDYLYPRFDWSVVATYDKAVEEFDKRKQKEGREPVRPDRPALVLNPSGDINIDVEHGGKQLFRFPNLSPGYLAYLFDPIYHDENIMITPGFTRLRGEIEFTALFSSFYEYYDFRIFLLQIFGGLERPIYPVIFNTFIILDNELRSYEYDNDVIGEKYQIDWLDNGASEYLVKTTNQNEVVFPCRIRPFYYLMSQSDASERYGGTDKLADYRLTFTLEYRIEVPTTLVIFEDLDVSKTDRKLELNISFGSTISEYLSKDLYAESEYEEKKQEIVQKVQFPSIQRRLLEEAQEEATKIAGFEYDEKNNVIKDVKYAPVNEFSFQSDISKDDEIDVTEYQFQVMSRYYHKLTSEELDNEEYLDIKLPIPIENPDSYASYKGFRVNSKFGELTYKDHYTLETVDKEGDTLRLKMDRIHGLNENDMIELFYYKSAKVGT